VTLPKPNRFYQQSGVIPFRWENGEIKVLLITSRGSKRWIFPKGIIENGLSPADSAAQEAFEEAGIKGKVYSKPIGNYEYDKWGGTCHVQVFMMNVEEELEVWPESTFRDRKWMTTDEAFRLVEAEELKALLQNLPAIIKGF
jgi:8-oxo-dGTP pyrophosphatase MutT (NUDIX family)